MGLNLFEGLRAAGQSFGQLANYADKQETEDALQLRQENLLRLKDQLDTAHDTKIEGMRADRAQKQQDAYFDRYTLGQAEQDNRMDKRLANSDERQAKALKAADERQQSAQSAAEKRQQTQLDTQVEMGTRHDMARSVEQARIQRQKAVDDIGKIKSRMAAYFKQQDPLGNLDPTNPQSIVDLAKRDPQALSYFQDLQDADNRRREADQLLQGMPQGGFPRGASSSSGTAGFPGQGPIPSGGMPLIPPGTLLSTPGEGYGNGAP